MDDPGIAEPPEPPESPATAPVPEPDFFFDQDAVRTFQTLTTLYATLAHEPTTSVVEDPNGVAEDHNDNSNKINYLAFATAFSSVAIIDHEVIATAVAPPHLANGSDHDGALLIFVSGNTVSTSPATADLQVINDTVHPDHLITLSSLINTSSIVKGYLEHGWDRIPSFQGHIWMLVRILERREKKMPIDLLKYVVSTCCAKIKNRLANSQVSKPYFEQLFASRASQKYWLYNKPSNSAKESENFHDARLATIISTRKDLSTRYSALFAVAQKHRGTVHNTHGTNGVRQSLQLYTLDTYKEFYSLFLDYLQDFKEGIEFLCTSRKNPGHISRAVYMGKLSLICSTVRALQSFARGSALENHLWYNGYMLRPTVNPSTSHPLTTTQPLDVCVSLPRHVLPPRPILPVYNPTSHLLEVTTQPPDAHSSEFFYEKPRVSLPRPITTVAGASHPQEVNVSKFQPTNAHSSEAIDEALNFLVDAASQPPDAHSSEVLDQELRVFVDTDTHSGEVRNKNGEVRDVELEALIVDPSADYRSLAQSYMKWLRLILVQVDAVDVLVRNAKKFSQNMPIKLRLLISPAVDKRLLPWPCITSKFNLFTPKDTSTMKGLETGIKLLDLCVQEQSSLSNVSDKEQASKVLARKKASMLETIVNRLSGWFGNKQTRYHFGKRADANDLVDQLDMIIKQNPEIFKELPGREETISSIKEVFTDHLGNKNPHVNPEDAITIKSINILSPLIEDLNRTVQIPAAFRRTEDPICKFKGALHCEVSLVNYIKKSGLNVMPCIGVSKPCCPACAYYLAIVDKSLPFKTRGAHTVVSGCSLPADTEPSIALQMSIWIAGLLLRDIQLFTGDVCRNRRHESATSDALSVSGMSTSDEGSSDYHQAETYRKFQTGDTSQLLTGMPATADD